MGGENDLYISLFSCWKKSTINLEKKRLFLSKDVSSAGIRVGGLCKWFVPYLLSMYEHWVSKALHTLDGNPYNHLFLLKLKCATWERILIRTWMTHKVFRLVSLGSFTELRLKSFSPVEKAIFGLVLRASKDNKFSPRSIWHSTEKQI